LPSNQGSIDGGDKHDLLLRAPATRQSGISQGFAAAAAVAAAATTTTAAAAASSGGGPSNAASLGAKPGAVSQAAMRAIGFSGSEKASLSVRVGTGGAADYSSEDPSAVRAGKAAAAAGTAKNCGNAPRRVPQQIVKIFWGEAGEGAAGGSSSSRRHKPPAVGVHGLSLMMAADKHPEATALAGAAQYGLPTAD
jgi:hypothetical protein